MKKKFLVCSIVVAAAALSAAAFAGCNLGEINSKERYRQNNMCFDLKDDGTYELTRYEYADLNESEDDDGNIVEGYKGEGETVSVPDKVRGKAVTSVKSGAFSGRGVLEVTLPSVISELPDGIFSGCVLLKKVNFSPVTSVGDNAFHSCESLESIEFKSGLTQIGEGAFAHCTSLATVTLPDTVKTIGEDCFLDCPFENINAAGVETIGDSAFQGCENLTSFDMSDVVSIGCGAFYGCGNITSLNMPDVVSIGENAFEACDKLTQLTIGDKLETCQAKFSSVTSVSMNSPVPDEMFGGKVTEATLGDGVTSIGKKAFYGCVGLQSITFPATLTQICDDAFFSSGLSGELTIPSSVKTVGKKAFYNCGISNLTIEGGVASVGEDAFCGCNSLKSITLNEGLEILGAGAFDIKGAENLDIVLPSTVKSVGSQCFGDICANKVIINESVETLDKNILSRYSKVNEIKIPVKYPLSAVNVKILTLFGEGNISDYAYKDFHNLKTVNLSAGIKSIGSNAFKGLQKINLDGVEFLGENALGNLSALTYTKTENGVNYIDSWVISSDYSQGGPTQIDLSGLTGVYEYAFKKTDTNDTSTLTTVFLTDPNGVSSLKQIGRYAFDGTGITGVQIPASLKSWNYAFGRCASLNVVAVEKGVEKIANGAFLYCKNLSGFNFANSDITEIGEYAFGDCENLRLITLPDSIKKIGECAFRFCTSLLTADLKGTEEIGDFAFESCTSLCGVTMNSVKTIGDFAFSSCSELTEIDLTASVTKIDYGALGRVETLNFIGTAEEWSAIKKYSQGGKIAIWSPKYAGGKYLDLKVVFADGSSVTYSKNEKQE